MPRAVDGTRRKDRRKKILERAKGFKQKRSKLFKTAKMAVVHALTYSYAHRRLRKRDMRSLWITRISAACRPEGITYSRLIAGLVKAQVLINRKALSNLAIEDPAAFKAIVEKAKQSLGA
jgi:large subunit ribosomal protein L20